MNNLLNIFKKYFKRKINLNNIRENLNLEEELKRYEKALQIAEQLGDMSGKANRLNNIGMIYDAQKDYQKALELVEEAYQIFLTIDENSKVATLKKSIKYIKSKMK